MILCLSHNHYHIQQFCIVKVSAAEFVNAVREEHRWREAMQALCPRGLLMLLTLESTLERTRDTHLEMFANDAADNCNENA